MTYQISDSHTTKDVVDDYFATYKALHPNVTINLKVRPSSADGDNVVKTHLATSDMTDIFEYFSGSQLQGLKPARIVLDLSKEPFIANLTDIFLATITKDGQIFGVPFGEGEWRWHLV